MEDKQEVMQEEKRHSMKPVLITGVIIGLAIVAFLTTKLKEKEVDYSKVVKYTLEKEVFMGQVNLMTERYKVRELDGVAVVHPKPGSDVYISTNEFKWGAVIELEKGETYNLHVASTDNMMHAIWVGKLQISQKMRKGKVYIISVTPQEAGEFPIVCRQFCGPNHYEMVGKIIVVDKSPV